MTPEQRRFVGIALFLFGALFFLGGGLTVSTIVSKRDQAAKRFEEAQSSCMNRLRSLGGEVSEIPGRIIWKKENLNEGPALVGQASVAAVLCPGWQLKTACVGSECADNNAMRIVLEPINADND